MFDEFLGDLAGTVGAEVEKYERVALGYTRIVAHDGWDEKFVGEVVRIRSVDYGGGGGHCATFGVDDAIKGGGDSFPAVVPVHCIISARHGGDFTDVCGFEFFFNLGDEAEAAFGVGVAAVRDDVNPDAIEGFALAEVEEGEEVGEMRVDSAVA